MTNTLPQKLLAVQKKIAPLTKDSNNPFFKSKYADLNQVLDLAKEALHPHNLFITQGPGLDSNGRYVETAIIDADSGQSITCRVPFSGNEKNMQEIGAATTYARRFGLVSLLALEAVDDDGESAVGRGNQAERKMDKTTTCQNAAPANGAGVVVKTVGLAGVSGEPKGAVPAKPAEKGTFNREATLKKITLSSKVIIDSKRDTQDNVIKMLAAFGVKAKEELNDEQAAKLLSQLEGKLNAK